MYCCNNRMYPFRHQYHFIFSPLLPLPSCSSRRTTARPSLPRKKRGWRRSPTIRTIRATAVRCTARLRAAYRREEVRDPARKGTLGGTRCRSPPDRNLPHLGQGGGAAAPRLHRTAPISRAPDEHHLVLFPARTRSPRSRRPRRKWTGCVVPGVRVCGTGCVVPGVWVSGLGRAGVPPSFAV